MRVRGLPVRDRECGLLRFDGRSGLVLLLTSSRVLFKSERTNRERTLQYVIISISH